MSDTTHQNKDRPSLPRRPFISDMPDRGLFLVASIAGFVAILYMRRNGFDAMTVASIAVAIMIIYGAIAYRIPEDLLPLDRLGDNLYYLGFIYTLASLSAALLQLDVNSDLKAILGNFGIALITTIIGISGRVAFVQMRREIDHAEATAQRDILEAATKLKGQLQASVSEFEVFLTSVRQALREQFETESQKSLKSATVELERISEVAKLTADRIAKAFDTHEQQAKRLGELVGQVATSTEQALKQLSETGQSLSNLGRTAEGVQGKLSNWIKDLETFATRMGEVAVMARNFALGKGKKRRWRFWRSKIKA